MGGSGHAQQQSTSTMTGSGLDYHHSTLRCSAPGSLPGSVVNVTLADMGMTKMMSGIAPMGAHMILRSSPASVAAGQVSLIASNLGWRTHELVVLPLAAGAVAGRKVAGGDGKVAEAGSLGEASGSCAARTGDGIGSGQIGWVTVTLAPGNYELVCNLPNHYADGMYQKLVVF
ncbi:MAG: sulfocyanin-like copper-binding protein [Jatrophihabitans sp.]